MVLVGGSTTIVCTIVGFILIIFGSFCNGVVIWTIFKSRNLYKCSINRTVLHLSAANTLDLLINIPLTLVIINMNHHGFQLHDWLCSAEIFQQSLITTSQLFFISVIGIERLLSIFNPYDRNSNLKRINILICCVWILGIGISVGSWFFFPVNVVVLFCRKNSKYDEFYDNFLYVHQPIGLAAILITAFSYIGIVIRVFYLRSSNSSLIKQSNLYNQLSAPVTVSTAPMSTTINPFEKILPMFGNEDRAFSNGRKKEVESLHLSSRLYKRRMSLRKKLRNRKSQNKGLSIPTLSLPVIEIDSASPEEPISFKEIPASPTSLQNQSPGLMISQESPLKKTSSFSNCSSADLSPIANEKRFLLKPPSNYNPNLLAPPAVCDLELPLPQRRGSISSSELSSHGDSSEEKYSFSFRGSIVSSNSSSVTSPSKCNSPTHFRKMELTTTVNSFIIILVFTLFWIPFPAVTLYTSKDHLEFRLICFLVGMISSVTNPILYGISIKSFRKEFRRLNEKRKRQINIHRLE